MRARPEVTVAVPTYQGAAYVEECLGSIAAQDLTGAEVLVNDDGSTDATVEVARSFADRIEHLRVERNRRRLGAVGNVNRTLRMARGRWVKPVFQDDLIEPGCLATMLAARRPGVPAVVCGRSYRLEDGVPDWQREALDNLLVHDLVRGHGSGVARADDIAALTVTMIEAYRPHVNFVGEPVTLLLHRRTALRAGGFATGYAQLWDYELVLRLAMTGGLALVDEPLATFRVHGGSETAKNLSGSAFTANVLDRLRLLVAYATGRRYRPLRDAAARQDPPVDLTALAVGFSWAARRVAAELPEEARPEALRDLDRLTRPLPRRIARPWSGSFAASRYAVIALHDLADDVDAAVADLYATERLTVDLATPEDDPPAPEDDPPVPGDDEGGPTA